MIIPLSFVVFGSSLSYDHHFIIHVYAKKGYVHPLGADKTVFVPKPRNRKKCVCVKPPPLIKPESFWGNVS